MSTVLKPSEMSGQDAGGSNSQSSRNPFNHSFWFQIMLAGFLMLSVSGCHGCRRHHNVDDVPPTIAKTQTLTLYWNKYQGSQSVLVPVSRPRPLDADHPDDIRSAVTLLLAGPTDEEKAQGFYSEIPGGTRLLGVHRRKGHVIVDLSNQFQSGGGSTSIQQRLEAVRKTVSANEPDAGLELTVQGRPLTTLGGEGLEVPESLQSGRQ